MSTSNQSQRGTARTNRPERRQVEMQFLSLDQWLDDEHRVRIVWQYVESLDLSELYQQIWAVEGHVGRNPVDPQILFALWLFATLEGISSARRLEELTTRDIAYMWICGGVSVNYHLLSDFRVNHGDLLERLMIDSIGVLLHEKLVTLKTVAQDGMRVRANAGTSSFRRKPTLDASLKQAAEHLQQLKKQQQDDPGGENRRQQAAQERAATERKKRLERAKEELEKLNRQRSKRKEDVTQVRASTTDPDARRMKMGDGGFRPALNVQFATDGKSRLILGVEVICSGSDAGQMSLMHQQLQEDYNVTPDEYLVDGQFATISEVTELERRGTHVHAPLPRQQKQLDAGEDPYVRKRRDTDEMAAFRQRMKTTAVKKLYQQRPSIAEYPNADCRNRGLSQFRVRGRVKAKAQTLWHVLAFNLHRMLNLEYLEAVMER